MLVDVVILWDRGTRLHREEVRSKKPFRAELVVYSHAGDSTAELKFPWFGGHGSSCPVLLDCRLRKLQGNDFLLVGRERDGVGPQAIEHPQAWWCRVSPSAELPVEAPFTPLHLQGAHR